MSVAAVSVLGHAFFLVSRDSDTDRQRGRYMEGEIRAMLKRERLGDN